jgi:hypothetical protein
MRPTLQIVPPLRAEVQELKETLKDNAVGLRPDSLITSQNGGEKFSHQTPPFGGPDGAVIHDAPVVNKDGSYV